MDERRDDWSHGVDENLASLNAGQRVQDRESQLVRKQLRDHDVLLRGDPEKDTDGQIARVHNIENELLMLKAVVLSDRAGGQGLVGRVKSLEDGDKRAERRWGYATAVTVAIISTIGFLITQWPKIEAFFEKPDTDPVHQKIERARHPKRHPRPADSHQNLPETDLVDPSKTPL